MRTKLLEIRDRGTTVPALAIEVSGEDGYLMRRAGFDSPMVYLVMLTAERCAYDPFHWPGSTRTMSVAHQYIAEHFHGLENGDVVDVEFILKETPRKKVSEQETHPL